MKLTNNWNRFVYRHWSPIYDGVFDRFFAAPGRQRAMEMLDLQRGERVVLVGIGTGADLPLLPEGVSAVGVDLSPDMLARARARLPLPGRDVTLIEADALSMPLDAEQFDAAVLHLVLSVVPDGAACLRETLRTLRPGGRLILFDKFAPDDARLTLGRRLVNLVSTLVGTDVTRRLEDLVDGSSVAKMYDEPSLLGGAYRVILMRKQVESRRTGDSS